MINPPQKYPKNVWASMNELYRWAEDMTKEWNEEHKIMDDEAKISHAEIIDKSWTSDVNTVAMQRPEWTNNDKPTKGKWHASDNSEKIVLAPDNSTWVISMLTDNQLKEIRDPEKSEVWERFNQAEQQTENE